MFLLLIIFPKVTYNLNEKNVIFLRELRGLVKAMILYAQVICEVFYVKDRHRPGVAMMRTVSLN